MLAVNWSGITMKLEIHLALDLMRMTNQFSSSHQEVCSRQKIKVNCLVFIPDCGGVDTLQNIVQFLVFKL